MLVSVNPKWGTKFNKQSLSDYYEWKSQTTTESPVFTTWLDRGLPCVSISFFMLGCNGSYTGSVICVMPHTVGDKIKFRIPFHKTAVAWLKKRGEKNCTPFGKKTAVLFDRRYHFNIFRSPHASLKEIIKNSLSNKKFWFFVYRILRRSFSGKKKRNRPIQSCLAENC